MKTEESLYDKEFKVIALIFTLSFSQILYSVFLKTTFLKFLF